MLSSVLHSQIAVDANIRIMRAFVATRRLRAVNEQVFQRLTNIEYHQIETDKRIDQVFQMLESDIKPHQGIFFDGQIFDAYTFVSDLIRSAKKSIVLFDNYVDDTVLAMLDKRGEKVSATIYTQKVKQQLSLDLEKHLPRKGNRTPQNKIKCSEECSIPGYRREAVRPCSRPFS